VSLCFGSVSQEAYVGSAPLLWRQMLLVHCHCGVLLFLTFDRLYDGDVYPGISFTDYNYEVEILSLETESSQLQQVIASLSI
jgi:hypothetical protein